MSFLAYETCLEWYAQSFIYNAKTSNGGGVVFVLSTWNYVHIHVGSVGGAKGPV